MIGFLRTIPIRKGSETLVPFALAAVIAILGALVYLELVTMLLEYAD
ncbi:hypothetical protein JMJ58_07335 [Haloterrigena salifodinae]|uniref:Uncharacterized protein n=1 Tax=Haloterrigena salifodinae TaxID=2675099 RepID=A0A8T8E491_9EURY|nr:hypothetical protein [Haloterrigena salifodinae]QRV16675.1 hypothetical protein JMJ58_07335 [Haloterrigena salifodinae]